MHLRSKILLIVIWSSYYHFWGGVELKNSSGKGLLGTATRTSPIYKVYFYIPACASSCNACKNPIWVSTSHSDVWAFCFIVRGTSTKLPFSIWIIMQRRSSVVYRMCITVLYLPYWCPSGRWTLLNLHPWHHSVILRKSKWLKFFMCSIHCYL